MPLGSPTDKGMNLIKQFSDRFFHAFYEREWVGECGQTIDCLSVSNAYAVQDLVAQKRIERGETVVGFKVGCTSQAIRQQFGLTEPISGRLFHPHILEENCELDWRNYLGCAIEPEMVLTIGKELRGKHLPDDELVDSIESVRPGIEIHNFHFWHSPPSIQELIGSGGIHAGLVVGAVKASPHELSFRDEMFSVYKNEIMVTEAPAKEIMGGPLHSLRWLVDFLTDKGQSLKKGSLVIPGSPTELVRIDQDTELKVAIEHMGEVTAFFRTQ